jgi:multiple sugar transport system permease protein
VAISMSFQDRLLGASTYTWVGLANYADFFQGGSFALLAVWNTFLYTGVAVGVKFLFGLAMACICNQQLVFRDFWRGLLFLPWAVPLIVASFVWMFVYDEQGFINLLLLDTLGWTKDIINFRGNPALAMGAVIAVAIWTGTPFYTMNFLAAMQAIPEDMYEAAEIDGAATFQRFWHITLPGLQGVILITTMLSAIWTSSNITVIYILTKGGPQHLTATVPYLAYELAIERKLMGAGAAVSLLMVPAYMVIVWVLSKRMLRQEG